MDLIFYNMNFRLKCIFIYLFIYIIKAHLSNKRLSTVRKEW